MQEPFPLALGTPAHLFSFADAGSQCALLLVHRLICRAQSSHSRTSGFNSCPPAPALKGGEHMRKPRGTTPQCAVVPEYLGVHADQSAQTKLIHQWPGVGCNRLGDHRQFRLHPWSRRLNNSRWTDKWMSGNQEARDRRHVSISIRVLLVSCRGQYRNFHDLCLPRKQGLHLGARCSAHPSNPCCHQGCLHAFRASPRFLPIPSAR